MVSTAIFKLLEDLRFDFEDDQKAQKKRKEKRKKSTSRERKRSKKGSRSKSLKSAQTENVNTVNQSVLSIEPTKLKRIDLCREADSKPIIDPAKSYMLSASVFRGADVHKPPLTKPKFKLSNLNKLEGLKEVAEESSLNSTMKAASQTGHAFIMDVSDLADDLPSQVAAQSQRSLSRNKVATPLGKETGPRMSTQGPNSRPSMRTQQSLKQLAGDHGLLTESEYDSRLATLGKLFTIEHQSTKRSESCKKVRTSSSNEKKGPVSAGIQSERSMSTMKSGKGSGRESSRYSAYRMETSAASSSKQARPSKPSIKLTQQPLPKLPLPKKPSNKPSRVNLKQSTAMQSTQAESVSALTQQTTNPEPVSQFSKEVPKAGENVSARTAFVMNQIALVTFADSLQPFDSDVMISKRERRIKKTAFGVLKGAIRIKRQKEKLARMFYRSRLVQTVLTHWHKTIKQLKFAQFQKQRINELLADVNEAQREQIKERAFIRLKTHCKKRQTAKAKIETVLGRLQKRFDGHRLKEAWTSIHLETLRRKFEEGQGIRRMIACFHQLKCYTHARSTRVQFAQDVGQLYETQLLQKTFKRLAKNRDQKIQGRSKDAVAHKFWIQHAGTRLVHRFMYQLAEEVVKQKTKLWARNRFTIKLKHRCLSALKTYSKIKERMHNQNLLVVSFYKCQLATKALDLLRLNVSTQKNLREKQIQSTKSKKLRTVFEAFRMTTQRSQVQTGMLSGPQIAISTLWLENSLKSVMDRIWKEFPKQKVDRDPSTRQRLLLVNYLRLSKQPRYRKFFFQANSAIRLYYLRSLFVKWSSYSRIKKTKQRQIKISKLQRAFKVFKQTVLQQINIRAFSRNLNVNKTHSLKHSIFNALAKITTKLRLLRSADVCFAKLKQARTKRRLFKQWKYTERRVQLLRQNAQMHNELGKQRTKAKFLACWFQALHAKLKVRHLDKLCLKFQKAVARRRYMRLWISACQKKLKANQVAKVQDHHLLEKCWVTLVRNTRSSLQKKRKTQAANQEFIYWLGKRVFLLLQRNVAINKAIRQLTQRAVQDFRFSLKRKVLANFRAVTKYIKQRDSLDSLITAQIRSQIKRKHFRCWLRQFSRLNGLKTFAMMFLQIQLNHGFTLIKRKVLIDDAKLSVHKRSAPTRKMQVCFDFLKANVFKSLRDRNIRVLFARRRLLKSLRKWKSKFDMEKQKVRSFQLTIIAIKHELLGRAMKALKMNFKLKKVKSLAASFRSQRLQTQTYDALFKHASVRQEEKHRIALIRDSMRQNSNQNVFFTWMSRLQQRRFHRACLQHFRKKFLGTFFNRLAMFRQRQQQKHAHVSKLRNGLDQIRRRQALLKFKWLTNSIALLRAATTQADLYHDRFMFRAAAAAWFNFYRSRKRLICACIKKQRQLKLRLKTKLFNKWMHNPKTMRVLRHIRSAQKLNKCLNKRDLRVLLTRWVEETNFLIALKAREEQGILHFEQKRKVKAIQYMLKVAQKTQSDRQQRLIATTFVCKQRKLKGVAALVINKEVNKAQRAKKAATEIYAQQNLMTKALKSLTINLIRRREEQVILAHFLIKQRQIYLPRLFDSWFEHARSNQVSRENANLSQRYHTQTLQVKVFQALLVHREASMHYRHTNMTAVQFYERNLVSKSIRTLLLHLITRREKHNRETGLIATISEVKRIKTLKSCFVQLQQQAELIKRMLQSRASQRRGQLKMNVFKELAQHSVRSKCLRHSSIQVILSHRQSALCRHFTEWRNLLRLDKTIKLKSTVKQFNIVQRAFLALREHSEVQRKGTILARITTVTLAVKAFQALKNHTIKSKAKLEMRLVAEMKRIQWIKMMALLALKRSAETAQALKCLKERNDIRKARKHFQAWENSYQLKLWRKNFFASCYRFVVRSAFRAWKTRHAQQKQAAMLAYLVRLKNRRSTQTALSMWRCSTSRLRLCMVVQQTLNRAIAHLNGWAFAELKANLEASREEQHQRLRIISMFESSRPENLIQFSKAFLQLNTDPRFVLQPAVCSTTLQKYAFDKWRNVLSKLRESSLNQRKAKLFYRTRVLHSCLHAWRKKASQHSAELQLSRILTDCRHEMTRKKCFFAMVAYTQRQKDQRSLCQAAVSTLYERKVKKAFESWVDWVSHRQNERAQKELVNLFNRRSLLKRSLVGLKQNQRIGDSKHSYSRKFSVFTAWKSLTKENRLLNKYLRECNFQSRPKSSYADLSSIVRNEGEEETKEDIGQLSFANHSLLKNRDEPIVMKSDINYLYGCKPGTGSVKESDEFHVECLMSRPAYYSKY